jgi:hypothetical protein
MNRHAMNFFLKALRFEDYTIAFFEEGRCPPIACGIAMLMNATTRCSTSRGKMRTFSKSTGSLQTASATHCLQRPDELCFEMLSSSGILLWAESPSGEGRGDQLTQLSIRQCAQSRVLSVRCHCAVWLHFEGDAGCLQSDIIDASSR